MHNGTTSMAAWLGDLVTVGNYTGFTKVALLGLDSSSVRPGMEALLSSLPAHGFEVVYSGLVENAVTDYSSYFVAMEAAGAEILFPVGLRGVPFVKEWYDRKSPCVIWGTLQGSQDSDFWELTEGKCETVSFSGSPVISGYPLTNKTIPTREAYIERWGTVPKGSAAGAYDGVRFILPDAIKRAGTFETEAVIKALETTNVETSTARRFVFTSSHDIMVGTGGVNDPEEDYVLIMYFQFQANGALVPVKPEAIMKEEGVTYQYPPWQGPWSNMQP
jgi:ABC-type branched-subunit amino acid transport system substrate-binding protein